MLNKLQKNLRKEAGFTFIEIMIVIVIIGFLASIVGPQVIGRVGKARTVSAQNQIGTFDTALEQYYLDNGAYPTTEQGLQALYTKPGISPVPKNWNGPYVQREIPKDPWGNPYIYKCPGEHNAKSYDLYSYGKDGQEGGTGESADITNWTNTQE